MSIWRASALGAECLRGLVAEQLGEKAIPYDAATELRMREGNLHEDDVVAQLTAEGYTVTRQQEGVYLCSNGSSGSFPSHVDNVGSITEGEWMVVGHLDGVINGDPFPPLGPRVLEIKSMGKDAFKSFKALGWEAPGLVQKYKWQLSVYMLATGLEALLVAKSRDSGELLRFGVEVPFYSLDEITERVAFLEEWVSKCQLPPDCPRDWFCNYRHLCTREESSGLPDAAERSPAPPLVQQYVELGETIRGLEAHRDELKEALGLLLGSAQSVRWQGYAATRVVRNNKERVVPASTSEFIKVTREKENT